MTDVVTGSIRYGWRLRLGMLLPSSNRVAEPELPAMLPEGVAVHTTRLRLIGGWLQADSYGRACSADRGGEGAPALEKRYDRHKNRHEAGIRAYGMLG